MMSWKKPGTFVVTTLAYYFVPSDLLEVSLHSISLRLSDVLKMYISNREAVHLLEDQKPITTHCYQLMHGE